MPDRRADLGVLLDRVPNLPVEDAPVRDHDDGVEDRDVVLRESDELVRKPRDGVALAASGGVLDEVAVPGAAGAGVGEQVLHCVDLVVARPDLGLLPFAGLLVLRLHDLSVVLEDIGQALAGQHLAPQVVGLEPVRVRRVARAVVPPAIEGQEPRCLALEVRAETHLVLVDREVRNASAELEQLLARIAVLAVLPHSIVHGLLRQVVLQLQGEDRQSVDEEPNVERPLGLVAAVAELAGDGEAVLLEPLPGLHVPRRGRAVEQVHLMGPVPDSVAQHVDRAALGNLSLEPREELAPRRSVLGERERFRRLGLAPTGTGVELDGRCGVHAWRAAQDHLG